MQGPNFNNHPPYRYPGENHDSLLFGRQTGTTACNVDSSSNNKGEYGLVRLVSNTDDPLDDGDDETGIALQDMGEPDIGRNRSRNMVYPMPMHQYANHPKLTPMSSVPQQRLPRPEWQRLLFTPLFPDHQFVVWGTPLLDGIPAVRLTKFLAVTWMGLFGMFHFVRFMNFENDAQYTIRDMIVYDGQPILMDAMVFFVVGRLYDRPGVDHVAWLAVATASGLFTSMETLFPFLQNSVTLYAMHCIWPWKLWVFVLGVIGICALLVIKHVQYLTNHNLLGIKIVEMVATVLLFLLPPMSSPYFHFHHWFAGWLVGMHCNLDVWWSQLTLAWCWGAYINGIAVYGRDPLLTCGYSFYLSWSLRCPYLQCYVDAMHDVNQTTYHEMEAQDWRNCSAADYVP